MLIFINTKEQQLIKIIDTDAVALGPHRIISCDRVSERFVSLAD